MQCTKWRLGKINQTSNYLGVVSNTFYHSSSEDTTDSWYFSLIAINSYYEIVNIMLIHIRRENIAILARISQIFLKIVLTIVRSLFLVPTIRMVSSEKLVLKGVVTLIMLRNSVAISRIMVYLQKLIVISMDSGLMDELMLSKKQNRMDSTKFLYVVSL